MVRSMTAYGRCEQTTPSGKWIVEIQSVNRKGLDVHFHLPPELLFLEVELKKKLSQVVHRGVLTVRISRESELALSSTALERLATLKAKYEQIATELGFSKDEISLPFLLKLAEESPFPSEFSEELESQLLNVVQEALQAYLKMKEEEGAYLVADIEKRISLLEKALDQVENKSENAVEKQRKKLEERLAEFHQTPDLDHAILREVALVSEKIDITEEILRFKAHLIQLKKTLEEKEGSVGRKLEFILQEMNREVNTMAAKNADEEVASLLIDMKSETDKIREQVQNIE